MNFFFGKFIEPLTFLLPISNDPIIFRLARYGGKASYIMEIKEKSVNNQKSNNFQKPRTYIISTHFLFDDCVQRERVFIKAKCTIKRKLWNMKNIVNHKFC